MVYRYSIMFRVVNRIVDYALLNLSMVFAYLTLDKSDVFWLYNRTYLPVVLFVNLLWFLSSTICRQYSQVLRKDSIKIVQAVIRSYVLFAGFIVLFIMLVPALLPHYITKTFLIYSLSYFGFSLGIWKFIFLVIRKIRYDILHDFRKVIIAGTGLAAKDLYEYFKRNPYRGYQIIGFFDYDAGETIEKELYKGSIRECIPYVTRNEVDEIFCTLPSDKNEDIRQLMMAADRHLVRFKFIPDYNTYVKRAVHLESMGEIPVMSVRVEPLEGIINRIIKRTFDIVFSLWVIVFVLSWLFPILAILIKLESRGAVLFIQLRSGRNNHSFRCFKFRSMRQNVDADLKQATRDDPRITRLGAFMRKTSLDELPQFFNVLSGKMSVVGPRPHMLKHTEEYSRLIDQFMVRHFLKPGITGWAQINGLRGETKTSDDMLKRVEADVWYLENWSFLLDLKIICYTFLNVFKKDQNAF
ncbi:undecaprenyl-phosphate glucose phosphotransferase [Compostibacter hankyongensis]|uniref:Undecaprenyl-phosphate glucose phosphotransferase n=1 Tax=Compostibacter hankyongensis TaxID=1007089 RepID=A0ABP8G8V7_9BACT